MHSRAGAEGAGAKQGALVPAHHHEVPALTRPRQQLRQRRPRPGVARLRLQKTRCAATSTCWRGKKARPATLLLKRVSSALQGCGPGKNKIDLKERQLGRPTQSKLSAVPPLAQAGPITCPTSGAFCIDESIEGAAFPTVTLPGNAPPGTTVPVTRQTPTVGEDWTSTIR